MGNVMRHTKLVFGFLVSLAVSACAEPPRGTYVNALTGEECTPDSRSYVPRAAGGNDQCQGTSNGDNCDDLHSGKIDCIGDGNSGQGDDKKHNCDFPQPGCDEDGCCDGDIVDPPPPPPDDDGSSEPDAGPTDVPVVT